MKILIRPVFTVALYFVSLTAPAQTLGPVAGPSGAFNVLPKPYHLSAMPIYASLLSFLSVYL